MRVILLAATSIRNVVPGYERHTKFYDANDGFREVDKPTDDSSIVGVYYEAPPDELAEMAGRLCYLSYDRPNPDTATNEGYIANIIAQRHFSVLEHASATFYIDGVTRNFTHELIRHRHLSFSEVSQRYVNVSKFKMAIHPGLFQWLSTDPETDDGRDDLMIKLDEHAKKVYNIIVDELVANHGYKRKEARQAARHVLPSGLETKIVVSGNMRAWREMLEKRLSPAADAEFREVAQKILAELRVIAPNTFQDFE